MTHRSELVDDEGIVRIGSVVLAVLAPHAGDEIAFDHWYGDDHFYTAGTAAPGVFAAEHFVDHESNSHLALYFVLPGFEDERVAFATEQVERAATEDRLFSARTHLHTWTYVPCRLAAGPKPQVPPSVVLDRACAAVSVVVYDGDAAESRAAAATDDDGLLSSLLLEPVSAVMPSTLDEQWPPTPQRRTAVLFHRDRAEPLPDSVTESASWHGTYSQRPG